MSAIERPPVLFVDDEPMVLQAMRLVLHRQFEVVTADGGRQGLLALAERAFAVVVSDFAMPRMNGLGFLAEVRRLYPRSMRMLLTGDANGTMVKSATKDGTIFRLLSKPCLPSDLIAALNEAIATQGRGE